MWKYKGDELGLDGITGVPNRDMSDEEFRLAQGKYARKFVGQPKPLENSGLWEHVKDETPVAEVETANKRTSRFSFSSPSIEESTNEEDTKLEESE